MTAEISEKIPYPPSVYILSLLWVLFALGPILIEKPELWGDIMWVIISATPVLVLIAVCLVGMIYSFQGKKFPKIASKFSIKILLLCTVALPICLIIYYS